MSPAWARRPLCGALTPEAPECPRSPASAAYSGGSRQVGGQRKREETLKFSSYSFHTTVCPALKLMNKRDSKGSQEWRPTKANSGGRTSWKNRHNYLCSEIRQHVHSHDVTQVFPREFTRGAGYMVCYTL